METYAARLASFDKAHPTTKKRSSNAKGAKTLKWPHKTPTPAQLATAGFFYQPTASSPDNATCFLCERALDGWEEDDDPIKEHLNYSADCGWILNVGIEQDIENVRPLADYGRMKAREDGPARLKRWLRQDGTIVLHPKAMTLSNVRIAVWAWMGGSQRIILSESDSHLPNILANWGSNEHQRRSPGCAFFTLMQSLNPPRAKKGRPSKASRMSTQSDVTAENLSMIEVRIDEGNSTLTTATHMTMSPAAPKANKKVTKAKKGKGKAQIAARTMEPEEAVQMSSLVEPEDDDFAVKIEPPKVPKGKRGKKRTSKEMDAEEAHVNEPLESSPPPAKRRTTRNRSSTVKPPNMLGSSILPMPKDPPSRKPSKNQHNRESSGWLSGRSNRASVLLVAPTPNEPATDMHESVLIVDKTIPGRSKTASPVIPSPRAESHLPEHQPIEDEIQQPHMEHIQDVETEIQTPEPTQPEPRAVVSSSAMPKRKVPSPTPSPQSSNAENAPPSSLPSQRRPPLTQLSPSKAQTIRIPLAASTPTISSSKRKRASKLETTCAWTSVDIEKIFMGSPGPNGKSSRLFDETNMVLTTPEKRMTVEEWILYNAKKAEERLRSECERLVGRFEGEGVRALRALEGIVCIE
ncbi:MAG: hypothetical protein Q9187_000588 [Circinaria calcarea]